MEGIFITLEGPDGSGKSTALRNIREYLDREKLDYITTREPGGTKIGEDIRQLVLDKANTGLAYETEALLYAASRAQHIDQLIEPELRAGKIVISDRFLLSSLAYQGVGRDLGIEEVKAINDFGLRGLEPDLILFFHIDPEETLKRKTRRQGGDRLESEGNSFHRKVYNGYLDLIDRYPDNIVIIDAKQSIENVKLQVIQAIEELLKRKGVRL